MKRNEFDKLSKSAGFIIKHEQIYKFTHTIFAIAQLLR